MGGGSGRFKAPPLSAVPRLTFRCSVITFCVYASCSHPTVYRDVCYSVRRKASTLRMQRTLHYRDTAFSKEFTQFTKSSTPKWKTTQKFIHLHLLLLVMVTLLFLNKECKPFCSCTSKRALCSALEVVFWFTIQLEHVHPHAASRRWCTHRLW